MADGLRIDKWIWFARLVRTRTAAQKLIESGHVRINRQKIASAAQLIRQGDVLTIALPSGVRVLRVAAFATQRRSAREALYLYEDLPPGPGVGSALSDYSARRPQLDALHPTHEDIEFLADTRQTG